MLHCCCMQKDASPSNYSNIDKLLACQSLSALRDHHHLLLTNNLKNMLRLILQVSHSPGGIVFDFFLN